MSQITNVSKFINITNFKTPFNIYNAMGISVPTQPFTFSSDMPDSITIDSSGLVSYVKPSLTKLTLSQNGSTAVIYLYSSLSTTFIYSNGINVEYSGSHINANSYSGYPNTIILGDNVVSIGSDCFKDMPIEQFIISSTSSLQAIGSSAFSKTKLVNITIPDTVHTIGEKAFYECDLLSNIIISSASVLKSIGSYAFADTKITTFTVPSGVSNLTDYLFYNSTLSSINIHPCVTHIGSSAFSKTKLTSVNIPVSITVIGEKAFYDISTLTSVEIIGTKLQTIGVSAFEKTSLTSIAIPSSVTTISRMAFNGITTLRTVLIYANSCLKIIDDYAFQGTSISTIFIPKSISMIGDYAFANSQLEKIELLGNSLRTIGDYAFANTNIKRITISNSVTAIGGSAFFGVTPLEIIFSNGSMSLTIDNNTFTPQALTALFAVYNYIRHDYR